MDIYNFHKMLEDANNELEHCFSEIESEAHEASVDDECTIEDLTMALDVANERLKWIAAAISKTQTFLSLQYQEFSGALRDVEAMWADKDEDISSLESTIEDLEEKLEEKEGAECAGFSGAGFKCDSRETRDYEGVPFCAHHIPTT